MEQTTTTQITATTIRKNQNDRSKQQTAHKAIGGRGQAFNCILVLLLLCLLPLLGSVQGHKPKTATQNKQPHQPAHNNDVTVNNMGGVADVPPTYQVKSSQTSNEDEAELLYPYQSEEHMFGEEEEEGAQLNTVHGEGGGGPNDQDNVANQHGINGKCKFFSASLHFFSFLF